MVTLLEKFLYTWPKPYIQNHDLFVLYLGESSKRYDAVKYALRSGTLQQIRKGLYFINLPHKPKFYGPFELAQSIYGPSYISLQSALSSHGWIPEAVYTITSVSTRRSKIFETPLGLYSYEHTPPGSFYLEVSRIEQQDEIFLLAEPWKALADYIYCHKIRWKHIEDLCDDLRIEPDSIKESNLDSLNRLALHYDSEKVKRTISQFLRDLTSWI